MKTIELKKEEIFNFLKEGELAPIVDIDGKQYAQCAEVKLQPGNQFVTVLPLYYEEDSIVTHLGKAVVYFPDEGSKLGVLVSDGKRVRWSAITAADVAIKVSGNWTKETTSDWLESQFQ
jgi:hypothetical protein